VSEFRHCGVNESRSDTVLTNGDADLQPIYQRIARVDSQPHFISYPFFLGEPDSGVSPIRYLKTAYL
jgi:hypothetical protein